MSEPFPDGEAALRDKVRAIIAGLAGIDMNFSDEADVFRDLGVESGTALDLLLQLEEEFEISIDDEAFGRARSLAMMTKLISEIRGAA